MTNLRFPVRREVEMLVLSLLICLPSFPLPAQDHSTGDQFPGQSCTSIMVSRTASTDGSVITSHTCDGRYRTWATIEKGGKHGRGEMHEVLRGTMHTSFPGDTTGVRKMGEIPQARRTYSYLNTAYPSFNEKQLGIGETTFSGPDTLVNPAGWFTIEELERVALQRCSSAREAIRLMGSLAERYGYGDGGECLSVADKKEVWQFEIVGCGKDRIGAVWVAKKVPEGHVAVSANIPRIGRLEREDKDSFMASDNVEQVAMEYGLWDGEGELIFWKAFNSSYGGGKNFKEREFFILSTLAPSLGLSMDMDELPFSVVPENKVSVEDVMALLRSTYEGTDMDMTAGILYDYPKTKTREAYTGVSPIANPWMTTATLATLNKIAPGTVTFRRTVSVAWCAYSHVIQLRDFLPDDVGGVCYLALDNPGQSPRIPIFCGTESLPEAFSSCGQKQYREDCALWTFRRANKLATLAWQRTKEGFMQTLLDTQSRMMSGVGGMSPTAPRVDLTAYTARCYGEAARAWKEMEGKYWSMFGLGF